MSIAERKGRLRAERERRIVSTAREIAEREGWDAVTIRRLAEEIEYSQPVLYSHFENRHAIVAAVAIEGFEEIASAIGEAAKGARGGKAPSRLSLSPISPLHQVVLRSTRRCSFFRPTSDLARLKPSRNY